MGKILLVLLALAVSFGGGYQYGKRHSVACPEGLAEQTEDPEVTARRESDAKARGKAVLEENAKRAIEAEAARKEAFQKAEELEEWKRGNALVEKAQASVLSQLFDAESARFQGVERIGKSVVCGEVNAKNQFGGYVGFKPFIFHDDGSKAIVDTHDFPVVATLCQTERSNARRQ